MSKHAAKDVREYAENIEVVGEGVVNAMLNAYADLLESMDREEPCGYQWRLNWGLNKFGPWVSCDKDMFERNTYGIDPDPCVAVSPCVEVRKIYAHPPQSVDVDAIRDIVEYGNINKEYRDILERAIGDK